MKILLPTLMVLTALVCVPAAVWAETPVTVRLSIGQEEVLIDLLDNPAAREFAVQLPLTLPFKDYAGEEKIATLPQRLNAKGSPNAREFSSHAPVDFTYFAPWGNLAVFYQGFGGDGQLLALGRIRTGKTILAQQSQDFTATLELVAR